MGTVVPLKQAAFCHADINQSIFLALRDAVSRARIQPALADALLNYAAEQDCRVAKLCLERILEITR